MLDFPADFIKPYQQLVGEPAVIEQQRGTAANNSGGTAADNSGEQRAVGNNSGACRATKNGHVKERDGTGACRRLAPSHDLSQD